MAICYKGIAGFILLMILACNVLYLRAPVGQMHHRKALGWYESGGKKCGKGGDYCFVKRRGLVSDREILALLHINSTLTVDSCMHACITSSCGAFLVFDQWAGIGLSGCLFFHTTPQVTENRIYPFDFYIRTADTGHSDPPAKVPAAAQVPVAAQPRPSVPPATAPQPRPSHNKNSRWIWLLAAVPPAIPLFYIALMCYVRTKTSENTRELQFKGKGSSKYASQAQTKASCVPKGMRKLDECKKLREEMQTFRFKNICAATDQFSSANKLGEGGFGPVYKGSLHDGQEVAVKRLSRSSSQGMVEFKNEIDLIAKLQHTNLVKLLGCCIERSEKILVYEFLTNKSLDSFLFDPTKRRLLDWKKRLDIIEGTAQGLLYLHKHSRLKVIHRDMKTSNILLDSNLKPKISDFGMARIFEQNASEANTNRVVGTYGYMSPEYAMAGVYSEKSDVFSFGVIVLEIMTGKKATSFSGVEHPLNLIRYAWDMWKEGKCMELIDESIEGIHNMEELVRHIHVGLLCVEENAADRPAMSGVVSMLTNMTISVPYPKQPAFYCGKTARDVQVVHLNGTDDCSPNLVTISPVLGR